MMNDQQQLFFVEFLPKKPTTIRRRAKPFQVPFTMDAVETVWTLFRFTDRNLRPELPYQPTHHHNAFVEDPMHDWRIDEQNRFHYASRITDDPVWILVELKQPRSPTHFDVMIDRRTKLVSITARTGPIVADVVCTPDEAQELFAKLQRGLKGFKE
jgi:hypothetical protein